MALVNGAGQLLTAGVSSASSLGNNVWQVNLAACANSLRWTEGTKAYKVAPLVMAVKPQGIEIQKGAASLGVVSGVSNVSIAYIYRGQDGSETVSSTYDGPKGPGGQLVAVGLTATGSQAANRSLTARVEVAANPKIEKILSCGENPNPPGTGTVTVVVNPAPPGGGDLTLGATNYTRNFRFTQTFTNVPTGTVRVDGREVWSDSLTAWTPSPASQQATLYNFSPLTFRVSYSRVPGYLRVEASSSGGTVRSFRFTLSGQTTQGEAVSIGPENGPTTLTLLPGNYTITFLEGSGFSRSCDPVNMSPAVGSAGASVRSYETRSVTGTYEPTTGCLDVNVLRKGDNDGGRIAPDVGWQ